MSRLQHLRKLQKIKRKKHHPLIHQIHQRHKISKKTLFYVKEYGPHSHVPRTIIRESIKILIFASVLSSLGGLALEHIKAIFVSVLPLIILLPTLNDMVGDFGTIIASRFSTMLHENGIKKKIFIPELKQLWNQVLVISVITTILTVLLAIIISYLSNFEFSMMITLKVFTIAILTNLIMITTLFFIGVWAGRHFYRKAEDPNNFLIPLLTAIADFMNILVLSGLIVLFF
ncbi:MAG TPA: magnesium transporter [Candidatus Nanoarchaeia archaeon]|nr:magnesium transporter [Candidatus Nanoarchaeia archaeon]